MIDNVRLDYDKDKESINMNKVSEFVHTVQIDLAPLSEEINKQKGVLVVRIFSSERMTYSIENVSAETSKKISELTQPPAP
jgi:hypothetical protein